MVVNLVGDSELLSKIVLIKGDLRDLGFVRDCYADVANLHFTIHTIESVTPSGMAQVLREMYRILKPGGILVVTENFPDFTPVDEAQEVFLELSHIEREIADALGVEARDVEREPAWLAEEVARVCYAEVRWRKVGDSEPDPTLKDWARYLLRKAEGVGDPKVRKALSQRILDNLVRAEAIGLRDAPSYALYARKPL